MNDATSSSNERLAPEAELEWSLNLKDFLELFSRQKWLIGAAVGLALLGTIVFHTFYPSYSVKSYLFLDSQSDHGLQSLLGALSTEATPTGNREREDEKALLTLESTQFYNRYRDMILASPEYPQIKEALQRPSSPIGHLHNLRRNIFGTGPSKKKFIGEIGPDRIRFKNKGIVELMFSTPSPELSVFLSKHYLDAAVQMFSQHEDQKVEKARIYVKEKIGETVEKMKKVDDRIVNLSQRNANLSLLAPQSAIAERMLKLREQIEVNKFSFEQNAKVIERLEKKLGPQPYGPSPEGKSFQAKSSLYGVKKTIDNLKLKNELLKIRIATLKEGLNEILKSNMSLPKEEQQLADFKRQKEIDFYVFDNLFKTLLEIEVKGLSLLDRVYPLQQPLMDDVKVTTGLMRKLVLASLGSAFFACVAIFCMNLLSPVIRNKKDFEGVDMSHLGSIPMIASSYLAEHARFKHLCRFGVDSKETVAFRHIRSRLEHLSKHSGTEKRKIVSMLSYGNGAGKTFVSSNVAASFAHMGKKTLLIDLDLRRANLSKIFGYSSQPGMCAHLDHGKPIDETIIRGVQPNLDIIPAGNIAPHTTDHLSNEKFNELMMLLKPDYDFIVIDTAPMAVAHESMAIAKDADFAVLMTSAWSTKKEYVLEALEEIKSVRKARTFYIINKSKDIDKRLVSNYYYMGMGQRKKAQFNPQQVPV